jgi:hypothetical protein
VALIGYANTGSAEGSFTIGSFITNTVSDSLQIGVNNTGKITILTGGELGI